MSDPIEPSAAAGGFIPLDSLKPVKETGGLIKAWSFSALQVFEKCPYQAFLKSVRKIPQPDSPASARGTAIHTLAEDYVSGKITERPAELDKLGSSFDDLRARYENGSVILEGEWGFDKDWGEVGWFSSEVWARIKGDAVDFESETCATVIDHKTGKKFGNELKHGQQLQLYAIALFLRYPEVEFVNVELWYIDQGVKTAKSYTREEAMLFLPRWTDRANRMTNAESFIPKPSKNNCKWCPYRENKACEWAVEA